MTDLKQFKINGDTEIVCEVIEWADDEYADLLIRRAFEIKTILAPDNTRFYILKPWMALQEGKENYISLNTMHIMAEANPAKKVIQHYKHAVKESELTESEVEKRVERLTKKLNEELEEFDNIIPFAPPGKTTIH